MAFLIRTIDFTAAGREIVRDRVLDQASLAIGRAAENEIHLPDLAVEQHHARIDVQGAARLAVARESDGTIAITIRQVAPEEGKGDALRGFQLASVLPSKRAMSWVFAAAILVMLLMVPVTSHLLRTPAKPDPTGKTEGAVLLDSAWSAGELSLKHHSLEDNCESCHVAAFESVKDETCLSCHKGIGEHADRPRLVTESH